MVRPAKRAASALRLPGVTNFEENRADKMRRPGKCGASDRTTVSTSGNSGIKSIVARGQYILGKILRPEKDISVSTKCAWVLLTLCAASFGQRGPAAPLTPRAAASIDLTGTWVSLITEDWRYRALTAPKGDFVSIPLNPAGRDLANAWDPAKDEAAGEQCKGYGVGGLMRLPGRLRISWQDENTLKVETDTGTQTRMLWFGTPQSQGGDWQGVSIANWDRPAPQLGPPQLLGAPNGDGGALKVVTTKMRASYLRKNGIPMSANAVITEYWDRIDVPNADPLLVIVSELVDPTYLTQPVWTSTHFRKQNDATGWNPTPCSAR